MGKGTRGVKASPEQLENEVESIRESMDPLIDELDHRRHELMDWRLQLQRHGPTLLKTAALLLTAVTTVQAVRRAAGNRRRRGSFSRMRGRYD